MVCHGYFNISEVKAATIKALLRGPSERTRRLQLILDESKQWNVLPFYGPSVGMLQKHLFPNRKNY